MYEHTDPIDSISDTLCLTVCKGVHTGNFSSSVLEKENVPLLRVPRSELVQSGTVVLETEKKIGRNGVSAISTTDKDRERVKVKATDTTARLSSSCPNEAKKTVSTTTIESTKSVVVATADATTTTTNTSTNSLPVARSALTDVTAQFSNKVSKVPKDTALKEASLQMSESQKSNSSNSASRTARATLSETDRLSISSSDTVDSGTTIQTSEASKSRVKTTKSYKNNEQNFLKDQGKYKPLKSDKGSISAVSKDGEAEEEEELDADPNTSSHSTTFNSKSEGETGVGSDTEPTSVYSFESVKNYVVDADQDCSSATDNSLDDGEQLNAYSAIEPDDTNSRLMNPIQFSFTEDTQELLQQAKEKYYREEPDPADDDTYDIAMVPEMANDIFEYMKDLEVKYRPNPNYMHYQRELRWSYRRVLLDWIVEVHQSLQLLPETLYLTVNIIDRFLSRAGVLLNRFQLVGAASLFIAAKYEEINCPTLKDMVYMLNNAYTKEEILEAEEYVIITLDFEISWPGPMSFLRRVSKADDYEYEVRTLAKYLLESAIMDSRLVSAVPSWLAAASYFLSKVILGHQTWSLRHIYYSGYTQEQILPLATIILENCRDAENRHRAIFKKYSQSQHLYAAQMVAKWIASAEERVEKSSSNRK